VTVETAWTDFHERMRTLGERITGPGFPSDARGRAEGFRFLARLQQFALPLFLEFGDPMHPAFMRFGDDVVKWGATNADNRYLRATIEGSGTYRIRGNVADVRELILSVRDGEMVLGRTTVLEERTLSDLDVGPDGSIEVLLGGPEQPGNWLPLHPTAAYVQLRQFVSDWLHDGIADVAIDRIDSTEAAPPALSPETVATALRAAAEWIEASVTFWNTYTRRMVETMPANVLGPPRRPDAGALNMLSGGGWFELGPDDALIIECDVPHASYWSVQLYTVEWFESLDFGNRLTSLNDQQTHIDDDGRFRIVIAHEDPGVPNWLDTAGHQIGLASYRWVRSSDAPAPRATVVPLRETRERLPASTPRWTCEHRRAQLAERRAGWARRFRN
jgi:hypothetical protein